MPASNNDRSVYYKLIDITGLGNLWTRQLLESSQAYTQSITFAKWGTFKGDKSCGCSTCKIDSPHAPWGCDHEDDRENYAGELALDTAAVVADYFKGLGNYSNNYISNKYLEDLKREGNNNNFKPKGWPTHLKLSELFNKLP